jgi:hypothetical protein
VIIVSKVEMGQKKNTQHSHLTSLFFFFGGEKLKYGKEADITYSNIT